MSTCTLVELKAPIHQATFRQYVACNSCRQHIACKFASNDEAIDCFQCLAFKPCMTLYKMADLSVGVACSLVELALALKRKRMAI